MKRLRIAHVVIQPVVTWDDGEELQPGPNVDAVALPLSQAAAFIESLSDQVAELGADLLREEIERLGIEQRKTVESSND